MSAATSDAVLLHLDGMLTPTRRPAHPLLDADLRPVEVDITHAAGAGESRGQGVPGPAVRRL